MKLRKLDQKDALLMLEWMHDETVVRDLGTAFINKTIQDCEQFIKMSEENSNDLHLAIVSDTDEYMGTVSLKHIDYDAKNAEFAIAIRSFAMGKGYGGYGMTEIIRIAFEEMGLECVYWCVSNDNIRACRFYEKQGFHQVVDVPGKMSERYSNVKNLRWYSVLRGDDYRNITLSRGEVAGCKIINITTIPTVEAGEISFFETGKDLPFDIKRVYYISKVPEGIRRGYHAHKTLKQVLFCPYGKIQLVLENESVREEVTLSDPSVGIVIDKPIWREMLWLQKDSVLCVAASELYDPGDYIRDYAEFKEYVKKGN